MRQILIVLSLFLFSFIIFSCGEKEESTTDTTAPVIAEVTAVTTPTNDSTPNYTFSSNKTGTITYGGSCSSGTTSATSGNNTITFLTLSDGTYSDCTIIVKDSAGNASNTLAITSFEVLLSYVAVGSSGKTLTSSDGTSWTSRISGTTSNLVGVTYGNSIFLSLLSSWTGVIGGDNGSPTTGTVLTSSNGTSWTTTSATCRTCDNNTVSINDVTYGDSTAEKYVAVGQSGKILTSSDGTSWDNRSSGTTSNLVGVTYGNSKFLTMTGSMDNGTNSIATVLTSSNGTSWTSGSATCSTCDNNTVSINDVTYGNSTFVAVGQSGRILTSSNGTSWTTRTSGTTSNLIGVTYGNSTFLTLLSSSWEGVVGNSDNGSPTTGTVLTSSNGTTWTSTSTTCSTCDNSTFTLKDVTSKE